MILVDSSVWVDHLRSGNDDLESLLNAGRVLSHPFVVGELAMGDLRPRDIVLGALARLPEALIARHDETLAFVERHRLFARGIGWVDAHLLASTQLTAGASLWTRDKRLDAVASDLNLAVR